MPFVLNSHYFRFIPPVALAALALSASPSAHAHIVLMNPPSWVVESNLGDPQKTGPCGGTVGTSGLTPTNTVTSYTAGQTIMVTWKETVGHAGHFRISLTKPGESRDVLVDPPVVTTNGDGTSGNSISSAPVPNGTGNVLLDNLFPRTSVPTAAAEPFTQAITLPDEPCEKCTLQVIQFMADHAPGYFYHHCADIQILPKDNAAAVSAGGSGSSDVAAAGSASVGAGGSTSTGAGGASSAGSTSTPGSDDGDDEDDEGGCSISSAARGHSSTSAACIALAGLAISLWCRRSAR